MIRYNENQIDELSEILKNEGIICVPTDTVYGICGLMTSKKAYNKIMTVKNRPSNKMFPVMCADEDQIRKLSYIDEKAEKIIHEFMPGPITLILNKRPEVPSFVTNGQNTIAVRMATSESLNKLIKKVDNPIFMSSANKSGHPECKSLDEIEEVFTQLDGIMEGSTPYGKASTIIDCTTPNIKILREGPISLEEIEEVLNK